jgi:hypothetical protein
MDKNKNELIIINLMGYFKLINKILNLIISKMIILKIKIRI